MDAEQIKTRKRCVNIDWLEVYCLESNNRFPCNAEYYREQGYWVKEREYGTRQYNEMFTILDERGNPFIEVRRNPASGDSSFAGLTEFSTHIRLTNPYCYYDNAIDLMREFLIKNDYIFKRIFRIDICYDFEMFDSGDKPAAFCRRYLAKKYCKINQTYATAHGLDNWGDFDWETLSWGSPKSMVTTKLYNKTKELQATGNKKPYIVWCWYLNGLIDDPVNGTKIGADKKPYKPDIWRIEYSLKSSADNWLIIESQAGKRTKKDRIPHNLSLFDTKDKQWQRFVDLSFHYFRFKYREDGVRKDRCKDKVLFKFGEPNEFMQVSLLPPASKPDNDSAILRRRLIRYRELHADADIRKCCDVLVKDIDEHLLKRISPRENALNLDALQRALAIKMGRPEADIAVIVQEVRALLVEGDIF